ncbi:MAG: PIN domain-containing protein, partial [Cetobacterium sp.]
MKRITFDTNIFLHNLDTLMDSKYDDYEKVSIVPVISELDNIKTNSTRMDLKHRGRVATRKLKQHIEDGNITPLIVREMEDLVSLSKYEVMDDLIITICANEDIKLVTMDYNVYLKCIHLGVDVELVETETKIENLSMIYKGKKAPIYVSKNVIDKVFADGWTKADGLVDEVEFNPNECTTLIDYSNEKCKVMVKYLDGKFIKIKYSEKSEFWGLKA